MFFFFYYLKLINVEIGDNILKFKVDKMLCHFTVLPAVKKSALPTICWLLLLNIDLKFLYNAKTGP